MECSTDSPHKSLCTACLCFGRTLQSLREGKLQQCYLDIIKEIPLYNTPIRSPTLCLECWALLRKVVSFREQAQDSYRILQAYTNETLTEFLLSDVARPPALRVRTLEHLDIPPDVKSELKIEYDCLEVNAEIDTLDTELENNEAVKKRSEGHCDFVTLKAELKDEDKDSESASLDSELACINKAVKRKKLVPMKHKMGGPKRAYVTLKNEMEDEDREMDTLNAELVDNNEMVKNKKQVSAKHKRSTDERTEVSVKDELKDEDREPDILSDYLSDDNYTDVEVQAKADDKLELYLPPDTKERKRKVKKKRKNQDAKTPTTKDPPKILTIELTYEEMQAERARQSLRESYVRAQYKCESCLVGFARRARYTRHVAAKHAQCVGDYNCLICTSFLPTLESFQTHYKRHTRRYECGICKKRTLDTKVMEQHYYSTHGVSLKKYRCSICGHVSNSIDLHRYHADSHKARLQCPDCDKTFIHRSGLLNHRLAVHEQNNSFPCSVCTKVFRWKTSLKRHLEKHDTRPQDKATSNPARCETCKISFSSECSYKRHMKNSLKHVTQDQLRYVCDHCGRRFADKTKLRDHIEEKHLHRTYQCHICLKPSKNRVGLDQHVRNVHKRRPNDKMCHHCGKGFPTKMQLESHIRTHTGERPYICEFCPTMFTQQSNLYKHNRQVHLNMKSKRYPMCKKRSEQNPEECVMKKKDEELPDPYRPVMAVLHYSINDRYCQI